MIQLERPILQAWIPTELLNHVDVQPGHRISGMYCCWILKSSRETYLVGCIVPLDEARFTSLYLLCNDAIVSQILPGLSPPVSTYPDGALLPFSNMEAAEEMPQWVAELERCPVLQSSLTGEKVTLQDRRGPYPAFRVTAVG